MAPHDGDPSRHDIPVRTTNGWGKFAPIIGNIRPVCAFAVLDVVVARCIPVETDQRPSAAPADWPPAAAPWLASASDACVRADHSAAALPAVSVPPGSPT